MTQRLSNEDIARLLRRISAAYTVQGVNFFRIIAYDKAAEAIEKSNIDLIDLWRQNRLSGLPGIGKTIAQHLDQLFRTGKVDHFESVTKDLPQGMFPLLDVSGFGPKKAYRLASQFKLNSEATAVGDLLKAARSGKIAPLEGFGEKSEADIIESLERFKKGQSKKKRMSVFYALSVARQVIDYLLVSPAIKKAVCVGSLRRMVSTIGDIDIAVSSDNPALAVDWFLKNPKNAKTIETGPSGASIILDNGAQIDLRVTPVESFGSMLQYFTGSLAHNIHLREIAIKQGLSLSEYGIKNKKGVKNGFLTGNNFNKKRGVYEFSEEPDFYKALGLAYIPSELREDAGEIEAAAKNRLPALVTLADIKGEVHVHSSYDLKSSHDTGASSLQELLVKAGSLNYEYLGISDHNPRTSGQSQEQINSIMKRRKAYYEQVLSSTKSNRVNLFIMLETDIQPDGTLALPEKAFEFVDAVVVSVHSVFNMDKNKMTERIIKGLSHPKAKILAHPTGRLIGKRDGYDARWDEIFGFCKKNNKALEINSSPDRLDLADVMVRRAVDNGNRFIINTDSHQEDQMDLIEYGISVARRGWAAKSDILNTLPYGEFKKWLTESG